jgi:hypothetical protein
MRASSDRLLLILLLASAGVAGCKSTSPSAPPADMGADTQAAEPSGDPLAELEALEARMRALGLSARDRPPAGAEAEAGAARAVAEADFADDDFADDEAPAPAQSRHDPCADVCDLSVAICMLEIRICELASSHGEGSAYADACRRATDDCVVAEDACERCGS